MAAPAEPPVFSSTTSPPRPWSDLEPKLLSKILTHLHLTDIARFRAVCRSWHAAAGQHGRLHDLDHLKLLPWVVLPNGCYGTMAGDFFDSVPGLPEPDNNVTCLGGTAGSWLALDCTDDVFRRTNFSDALRAYIDGITSKYPEPRPDVRHKHRYTLYNPFTGRTVPLPELDSIVGDDVPETFEIRKVLARSDRRPDDDLVVVTTNNKDHTIIICRPGGSKGSFVLRYLGVYDVAFFRDALYGITEDEDLVVFDLAENSDGEPVVSGFKRVIAHPLDDGEEDHRSWMDDYQSINEDDDEVDAEDNDDDDDDDEDDDEATTDEDNDDDDDDDDDDVMLVGDGSVTVEDPEVPYEFKDFIVTTRHLVESRDGQELLMVRHQEQTPPFHVPYTRKLDIFKADMYAGRWVPVTATALAQGEALFVSRSTTRVTQADGDIIKEGCVYFVDLDDAFDTRSETCSPVSLPWQRNRAHGKLLTWVFPPQLVL